jgi:hypothetical protein
MAIRHMGPIGRTATMAGDLPGSPLRPLDPCVWLSHESKSRKRSLEKYPLGQQG